MRGLNKREYLALARFRFELRAFLAFSERAARQLGVTAQQYQALLAIKAYPGHEVLIKDLAAQLLLKHNAAVQLVDRLAHLNLVRRGYSSVDRRAVSLELTAKGETTIAKLASLHYRELTKRGSHFAQVSKLADKMK